MSRKKIFTLTALAFLIVGFTSFLMGQAAPTTVKQAGANASQVGRYQIVSNPNVRADTFLLDTQTGNTWTPVEITNVKGQPTIWRFKERVDNQQQFNEWSARQVVESSDQNDK
jgi:hypothetical protein